MNVKNLYALANAKNICLDCDGIRLPVTLDTINRDIDSPTIYTIKCTELDLRFAGQLAEYIRNDLKTTQSVYLQGVWKCLPKIKKVIFNPPATIIFWTDGTKTVVQCQDDDFFDYEKGLTTAITKKALGNKGNYCNEIKKWTKDQPKIIDTTTAEVILHDVAYYAYKKLVDTLHNKKSTKADLGMAMEEAIGYLGQLLDD